MLRLERDAEREWLAFTRQAAALPDPGTIVRDGGRRMREQLNALRQRATKLPPGSVARRGVVRRWRPPQRGCGSRGPRRRGEGADAEPALDMGDAGPAVAPFVVDVVTAASGGADGGGERPSGGEDAGTVARAERRLLAAGMMALAAHRRAVQRARARLRARAESGDGRDPRRVFGLSEAALQSIAAERGKYAKAAAWCARRRVAVAWAAWAREAAGAASREQS